MLLVGGSRRVCGSHTLGGSTVRPSIYSSIPLTKSSAVLALYATSQNICTVKKTQIIIHSIHPQRNIHFANGALYKQIQMYIMYCGSGISGRCCICVGQTLRVHSSDGSTFLREMTTSPPS